ncbi:death-on-curing family protein [Deinococcus radiopugnans ATCC 19172]|uniref:Death-on-curing family protein n=1 Tax=Deinococcus radiopugnans ATCC 19172 TaxID=585398 RepID=A0ABR6NUE8_9DEIO|nr:death-on-curing family protein [Deinococcus radiopugnans ATCC 19172]
MSDIHDAEIARFGGEPGLRTIEQLESAVAMPQCSMFGEYLHPDLSSQAAAYLYHLTNNHAFVKGNKRTAVTSTLIFLELNGAVPIPIDELRNMALSTARGELSKSELTEKIRSWQDGSNAEKEEFHFDEAGFWKDIDSTVADIFKISNESHLPIFEKFAEDLMMVFAEHGIGWIDFALPIARIQIVESQGRVEFIGLNFRQLYRKELKGLQNAFKIPAYKRQKIKQFKQKKYMESLALATRRAMINAGLQRISAIQSESDNHIGWTRDGDKLEGIFTFNGLSFAFMDSEAHEHYLKQL